MGAGGTTWQARSAVQSLVDAAIDEADAFELDASRRDAVVARWSEGLRRIADVVTVVLVLSEFEAARTPIVLEDGLEIDDLSDIEIATALAYGQRAGSRGDSEIISRTFGVRTSFETRLFVDDIPPEESEKEQVVRQEAWTRVELILLALRLFKAGRVGTVGTFGYSISTGLGVSSVSGGVGPYFGWHAGDPYVLTPEEASDFAEFWAAFRSAPTVDPIGAALRRFGYASERSRPDDMIVDLLIAAETLFFSDITRTDRGEFRFRLSSRVALLLGETLDERRRLAKFMRHAYDARSGIVHGDPGDENLRALEGHRVTATECADVLEDVLRRALRAAITLISSGEPFPPDWEYLMFVGRET